MKDADVVLEIPAAWFDNPLDCLRHQRLYASILVALADLCVTVRPIRLPYAADAAPRATKRGQLVISFHSQGAEGNVLRLKESYWPPYYTADPRGFSGFSTLARNPDAVADEVRKIPRRQARKFVSDIRQEALDRNVSKYEQPAERDAKLPRDFYFLPLQTVEDPVAQFAYLDQLDVAAQLAKVAADTGAAVVVKRHPLCKSQTVEERLEDLNRDFANLRLSTASVHQLIGQSKAVVGCNSGVLFEALIHGKPVVTFGKSDFEIATRSFNRLGELGEALADAERLDPDFRDRFLTWFLKYHCVHAADTLALRGRIAEALNALDIDSHGFNEDQLQVFEHYAQIERARREDILHPQ